MHSARGGSLLGSRRRPDERAAHSRRRVSLPPSGPLGIRGHASASAAAAVETRGDKAPPPPPSPLFALLAPRLPRLLPAAVFWDADNVRPSGGDARARAVAVRRGLADLVQQLSDAGCRVVQATAYGNAATLADEGGGDDEERGRRGAGAGGGGGSPSCCSPHLVVTNTGKRQSADMALLSDLAAFVSQQQQQQQEEQERQQQQQQQKPIPPGAAAAAAALAAPAAKATTPCCLVLLIADDAGYGVTCAWASAAPRSAVVVACGASAGRRGRYAPPASPAEPWRFHPLARSGAAAMVVPFTGAVPSGGGGGAAAAASGGGLDVAAAWINPDGLLA